MKDLTDEKIKAAMAQIKYVKRGFLGLYYYWTKPLEAHKSLRKAEVLKTADCLLKIEDRDIKLSPCGYKGNYNDTAIEVLKQIPDFYFGYNVVYAYSLKVKKPSKQDDYVDARISIFRGLDVPDDIREQEVLFNDNYPFPEDEQ